MTRGRATNRRNRLHEPHFLETKSCRRKPFEARPCNERAPFARSGEQGGSITAQAHRTRIVCDAYGWNDRGALIDEIEARFRRALAHAQENELGEPVRIWTDRHQPTLEQPVVR